MILDTHTFVEFATRLEQSTTHVLDAVHSCVTLAETHALESVEMHTTAAALVLVITDLAALEQLLRAVLEANREEHPSPERFSS